MPLQQPTALDFAEQNGEKMGKKRTLRFIRSTLLLSASRSRSMEEPRLNAGDEGPADGCTIANGEAAGELWPNLDECKENWSGYCCVFTRPRSG